MQNKHFEKQCYKNIALGKGHSDSNAMFFFHLKRSLLLLFIQNISAIKLRHQGGNDTIYLHVRGKKPLLTSKHLSPLNLHFLIIW